MAPPGHFRFRGEGAGTNGAWRCSPAASRSRRLERTEPGEFRSQIPFHPPATGRGCQTSPDSVRSITPERNLAGELRQVQSVHPTRNGARLAKFAGPSPFNRPREQPPARSRRVEQRLPGGRANSKRTLLSGTQNRGRRTNRVPPPTDGVAALSLESERSGGAAATAPAPLVVVIPSI